MGGRPEGEKFLLDGLLQVPRSRQLRRQLFIPRREGVVERPQPLHFRPQRLVDARRRRRLRLQPMALSILDEEIRVEVVARRTANVGHSRKRNRRRLS